jgi:hypothetical protein
MEGIFFLLIFVIIIFLVALSFSGFLMKRAIFKVAETFCRQDALDRSHAKTIDELGLQPPGFLGRITRFRDYKPQALQILVKREIIQMTPEGKLYMVEERLHESLKCKKNDLLPPDRRR